MDKKTLHNIINTNIQELENLINGLSIKNENKFEINLIRSKFQTLKEEIEYLSNMSVNMVNEESSVANHVEEIEEAKKQIATKTNEDSENITDLNSDKESQKNTIKESEKPRDEVSSKIIIKSSKPPKPRKKVHIQRVKKEDAIDKELVKPLNESIEQTSEKEAEKKDTKVKPKKEKSTIVADKFEVSRQSINDIISNNKTRDIATKYKDKPIENLKRAISINDKMRFTRELFNNDNQVYLKSIEAINSSNNLDEALEFLNHNFSWDQDKESFREFLELVYRRFLNN